MNSIFSLDSLLVPILIFNLGLGLFVYLTNKSDLKNNLFLGLATGTSLWIGGLLLIGLTSYEIGGRLSFSGALISAWFFLLFTFQFPKPLHSGKNNIFKKLGWFVTVAIVILSLLTPLVVKKEFSEETTFGVSGEFGVLYPIWSIYFIFLMGYGLVNLFKELITPRENKLEKKQLKYFFLGASSTILITATTNLILPLFGLYQYSKLGPLGTIFLISFTGLAILRYHLFEIKVILTEILVALMGITLMILIFFMPSVPLRFLTGSILFLFLIFGFLLIKATHEEVKRKEEAERLLKAKSEFLSIASHQLRTPLTAIAGYISMLKEGDYGRIPEEGDKAINKVYDSSQRMIKLVNDFLNVSRVETGRVVLNLSRVSLDEIILQIIAETELKVKQKGLFIKWNKPSLEPIVNVDPEKIKEAISNIVDNAIHYTDQGGITISAKIDPVKTTLMISDTGAGMDRIEIAKIFESFSRGSAGNKLYTQGSGLGLYIAKKFVELHGGRIWVESQGKGTGSAFYIELSNR